jgi:serine/threonine protein kinase
MRDEDSTFGAEPQHLDRLIALGLEDCAVEASEPLEFQFEGPGGRVGHYHFLQVLGEGGMGVVYLAEQEQPLRRKVALKIIKLGMRARSLPASRRSDRPWP